MENFGHKLAKQVSYLAYDQTSPCLITCWTNPLSSLYSKMEKFGHNIDWSPPIQFVIENEKVWLQTR
jgi:hypothetical protein